MNRIFSSVCLFCFIAIFTTLAVGCNKNDAVPETTPVSGKVTVDGEPVTAGNVSYLPYDKEQKTGAMSAGTIDATGGYVIYTGGKQGVPPGRYKVTVSPSMVPTGNKPSMPFDKKYADQNKTDLIITVTSSNYDLKLKK